MKYKFSVIIPFRYSIERYNNLLKTLEFFSAFNGVEIIIVEQDIKSKLVGKVFFAKHIFCYNSGKFNRSWAFNVGAKYVKSPIMVFVDGDIIMDRKNFSDDITLFSNINKDCMLFNKVVHLDFIQSNLNIDTICKIPTDELKVNQNKSSHLVIYKSINYFKMGGWLEDVYGCGDECEEDLFMYNIDKLHNYIISDNIIYHLYHTTNNVPYDKYRKMLCDKVLKSLDNIKKGDDLSNRINLIGMKNKNSNCVSNNDIFII